MTVFGKSMRCLGIGAVALLFQFLGCASPVPGTGNGASALSGKSLQVTITLSQAVNPNYLYYFLINNSNSSSGPGPIPVGAPSSSNTYGNGFATGSDSASGGFTDFVLYTNPINQYNGALPAANYALYHVLDGKSADDRGNFRFNGVPVQYAAPSGNGNQLYFQIDLAQLFSYPGSTFSQADAVSKALALQFMQVNVVATNIAPTISQTSVIKEYDSFGDDSGGRGNFLLMFLNNTVYQNGDSALAAGATEPSGNDVFISPPGSSVVQDPALDIVNWQIQIVNNSRAAKK